MASNNTSVKIMDYERYSAAVVMSAVAILTEPWQVSKSHATAYPKAGRRDTTTKCGSVPSTFAIHSVMVKTDKLECA